MRDSEHVSGNGASCFRRPVVIKKSMPTRPIALIGDYDPEVTAHRAIPLAVELASRETEPTGVTWLSTEALVSAPDDALSRYAGFWCVPKDEIAAESVNNARRA
jgi:hypothetical protein